LPDNDAPGMKHAQSIAAGLIKVAKSVRILNLPDLKPKGDVSDWLQNGGTKEYLRELLELTPLFTRPGQKKSNPLNLPPLPDVFTAADLERMSFPEPVWIVPGLIPEGVTLLAGKPKTGKSYAAMNIGLALACGGKALGKTDVQKQGVLYLCLEDRQRRLQNRISAIFCGDNWPSNFFLTITWPRIDQGGIPLLQNWFEEHPDVKLVIVDTLKKVKSREASNQNIYDADYQCIEALKTFADMMNISVLVLHHLRKLEAEDPFDCISGSTGLTGAVDTGMVLQKDRTGKATLYVRGRDIEELELALDRDPSGGWTILGDSSQVCSTEERENILRIFRDHNEVLTIKQICDIAGKKKQNVYNQVIHLTNSGHLRKAGYGKYIIASVPDVLSVPVVLSVPDVPSGNHGCKGTLEPPRYTESKKDSVPLNPHQTSLSGHGTPGTPRTLAEIICIECENFKLNQHKPNMQGRCIGAAWDNDPDQWPRLKHECAGFRDNKAH
ncbi:MAG: AAA family ATPase, partial [Syntrophobacteraceae bacterium]